MQFNSITGQKDTKEQLVQMIQHNRLSHALLFLGKEGSGALQLAQAFAQYIVCEKVNGKQTKTVAEPHYSETLNHQPQTTNHKPSTIVVANVLPVKKQLHLFIPIYISATP